MRQTFDHDIVAATELSNPRRAAMAVAFLLIASTLCNADETQGAKILRIESHFFYDYVFPCAVIIDFTEQIPMVETRVQVSDLTLREKSMLARGGSPATIKRNPLSTFAGYRLLQAIRKLLANPKPKQRQIMSEHGHQALVVTTSKGVRRLTIDLVFEDFGLGDVLNSLIDYSFLKLTSRFLFLGFDRIRSEDHRLKPTAGRGN